MPPIVLSASLTDRHRVATHCVLPITGKYGYASLLCAFIDESCPDQFFVSVQANADC